MSVALVIPMIVGAAALVTDRPARAEGAENDKAELSERCAVRLSIALLGKSASPDLLAAPNPLAKVDAMVDTPEFADRYARFINSELNGGPADTPGEDPIYFLAKHVIATKKPWSDLFLGSYDVDGTDVKNASDGLGYFRTKSWMKRYAGNEETGLMLVAAFRLVQNTTGLELTPSVGNPGDDRSTEGRKAGACRGCHFDAWYAIDTVAKLLPTREGTAEEPEFPASTAGPQQLLGKTLASDKDLVETLVASEGWRFNQCRNVFKFLYGRAENQCEGGVFDACVAALDEKKTISAAVASVAKDPSFCAN